MELASAYADALVAGDEIAAEIAIREAMDADLDTAEIDEKVIAPALWLIGELWERGQISIAEEHIATEITVRVLALQREAQRVARARGRYRVMLATPPGECHVVALRMVENLVRGAGYEVVMLGADVPATDDRRRGAAPRARTCSASARPCRGAGRRAGGDRRGPPGVASRGLPAGRAGAHRRGPDARQGAVLPWRHRRHGGG